MLLKISHRCEQPSLHYMLWRDDGSGLTPSPYQWCCEWRVTTKDQTFTAPRCCTSVYVPASSGCLPSVFICLATIDYDMTSKKMMGALWKHGCHIQVCNSGSSLLEVWWLIKKESRLLLLGTSLRDAYEMYPYRESHKTRALSSQECLLYIQYLVTTRICMQFLCTIVHVDQGRE